MAYECPRTLGRTQARTTTEGCTALSVAECCWFSQLGQAYTQNTIASLSQYTTAGIFKFCPKIMRFFFPFRLLEQALLYGYSLITVKNLLQHLTTAIEVRLKEMLFKVQHLFNLNSRLPLVQGSITSNLLCILLYVNSTGI